jgi:hypothetical protein
MRVSIYYSQAQLLNAAQYIWDNNPFHSKWPNPPKSPIDIAKQIHAMAIEDCRKNAEVLKRERAEGINLDDGWVNYSGTGGFMISYSLVTIPEDKDQEIELEFSVNPAIVDEGAYVVEVIDNGTETV